MGFHGGHVELAHWNLNSPDSGSSDLALLVDLALQIEIVELVGVASPP